MFGVKASCKNTLQQETGKLLPLYTIALTVEKGQTQRLTLTCIMLIVVQRSIRYLPLRFWENGLSAIGFINVHIHYRRSCYGEVLPILYISTHFNHSWRAPSDVIVSVRVFDSPL